MSKRNQIGYSLVFWETLKEYNEKTKFYEPTKNKRVEVSQMLSEELSDDEEVKSLLIDKLFEYKDDIKKMLMNGEYCDIPSYHKESLEKDQRIADLEAKLAEKDEQHNQDKIELLKKVKEFASEHWWCDGVADVIEEYVDTLISEIKGDEVV